jgi:hypothetical protein
MKYDELLIDEDIAKVRVEVIERYLKGQHGLEPVWFDEPNDEGAIGLCYCPHRKIHSDYNPNDTNPRQTLRIFIDRPDFIGTGQSQGQKPKIFLSCRHANHCVPLVWEDTLACRKMEESDYPGIIEPSKRQSILEIINRDEKKEKEKKAALAGSELVQSILDSAQDTYPTEQDIIDMSPFPIGKGKIQLMPYTQSILQLELFPSDELVWVGEVETANNPSNIRTAGEWIEQMRLLERSPMIAEDKAMWVWPGHFIAPCTFKARNGSKTKENMKERLFAVAEADSLNRNEQLLVIKHMIEDKKFPVSYVINSGSKSYHIGLKTKTVSEFDIAYLSGINNSDKSGERGRPKTKIGGMGFDPASLRPTQAVRLAGPNHPRTGYAQKLIYIDPLLGYSI